MKELENQKKRFNLTAAVAWWSTNGNFNWELYRRIVEQRHRTL